ncbi:MAG: papain-like cysteine protease family protein [Saprospiraceae bacterium]
MKNSVLKTISLLLAVVVASCCITCTPEKEEPLNLSGTWIGTGYQCPIGDYHRETVQITHEGNSITAVKITGDPCVPAGNVTFSGTFDPEDKTGVIIWTTGLPTTPACCMASGTLRFEDCSLKATAASWEEITFTRIDNNVVDYDILNAVPLIRQPTDWTCWAASATMMWSYRDGEMLAIQDAFCTRYKSLFTIDYCNKFNKNQGTSEFETNSLYEDMGLTSIQFSPSIHGFKQLLQSHGPLMVLAATGPQTLHVSIITGIHGDGSTDCTYLFINDPALGLVVESYGDFMVRMQTLIGSSSVIPIYHW